MTPSTYLPEHFLPVVVFLLLGTVVGVGMLVFSRILRPRNPYPEKLITYESGITPFMDAHQKFTIRYYIIAMLFLIFDIEAIFLYPWAVAYNAIGLYGFVEMVIFVVILLVGYVYAWKKGALVWE
ncbi:MAG TPA: NADH-quinone oxidoreductase subunit A [Nitrospirota bacterium]|nr:NADH-quinone oxidoreductase subunit A [Nitrospirota bacterium]